MIEGEQMELIITAPDKEVKNKFLPWDNVSSVVG